VHTWSNLHRTARGSAVAGTAFAVTTAGLATSYRTAIRQVLRPDEAETTSMAERITRLSERWHTNAVPEGTRILLSRRG
jgi:hypothetical protein